MENPGSKFLEDKYWQNEEFRDATKASARRTKARTGETVPNQPPERIENYLNRFRDIVGSEDPIRRERGREHIGHLVASKYVIKPENITDDYIKGVLLGNQAEQMGYDRNDLKHLEIKQTVQKAFEESIYSSLAQYQIPQELRREVEQMIITNQTERIKDWLVYLTDQEEMSNKPIELRYWVFAEMLKQGDYDPLRARYYKRGENTVATFPELDQQALGFLFDEILNNRTGKASSLDIEDEDKKKDLQKLLQSEDFGKLYAFMQRYVAELRSPQEKLAVVKGHWRLFEKGSNPGELSDSLQKFQTKWCIAAKGDAQTYLDRADVYIYFSEDADGQYSIPRACIVDDQEKGITEVRGIMFSGQATQHLDDHITPIVAEKVKSLPGGEKWQEQMSDMTKLRQLHLKHLNSEPFNKQDLEFLYEIDHPIQGTGHQKDPRIAELRSQRDPEKDMLVIFECEPEQIAHTPAEINENTKAYIGSIAKEDGEGNLLPEYHHIFHKLANIEHVYNSFPEGKIRKEVIEAGGKSAEVLIRELE